MTISSAQALAWRLGRQHLLQGASGAADVVRRLGAIPAWSGDVELAVRRRLADPVPGAVDRAVRDGSLIRTFAFRGSTHVLAADTAGTYLRVRTASRQWALRSWQDHYRLRPDDWPALLEVVRDAVADGPLDRDAFAAAVTARPRFAHLDEALRHPSMTLLKPIAWHGELCFGPSTDGRPTLASPTTGPCWVGLPDLDEAGPRAVADYLGAYGPATRAHLHHWLGEGLSAGRARVQRWADELLRDRAVEIDLDGERALVLGEHADEVEHAGATGAVTLLGGHDQWVLGPGTADTRVVPAERRAAVTRGAALVLHDGVVTGTWTARPTGVDVTWYPEAGAPPRDLLAAEAGRTAALLGCSPELRLTAG